MGEKLKKIKENKALIIIGNILYTLLSRSNPNIFKPKSRQNLYSHYYLHHNFFISVY